MKHEEIPQLPQSALDKRIAGLSPEKRALLNKRMARLEHNGARTPPARAPAGEHPASSPRLAAEPIPRRPHGSALPLSFAQQRLWFLDRLLPDKAAYNVPMVWRLEGPVDVSALQRALELL